MAVLLHDRVRRPPESEVLALLCLAQAGGRQHGDVSAIEKLFRELVRSTDCICLRGPGLKHMGSPSFCVPPQQLHVLKVAPVVLVVEAGVASRPIPLKSTALTSKANWNLVPHRVQLGHGRQRAGLRVAEGCSGHLRFHGSGRRKVPTLRVLLIDGLAIGARVICHTRCIWCGAFQEPAVKACLCLASRAKVLCVKGPIANPKLVVAHVVGGNTNLELNNLPGVVGALRLCGYQVRFIGKTGRILFALDRVAADAVRLGCQTRRPDP
mmetsp:Transcript_56529/g.165311  ORF Transcript_56529/g.165311 Transcript_56529/m.165311 type:complete len:267 (-) Transcript_56529:262-1062(-)